METHNYFIMRTRTTVVAFMIALLGAASLPLCAQKVRVDKTTAEGRTILTKESDYYGPGRDDKVSLNYFSQGDTEVYQLKIDFDESGKRIKEGYKMLLKQQSGNVMELTCLSGGRKDNVVLVPFVWIYDVESFQDANFLLSREQVLSLIDDPVMKLRMEYHEGYFDVDLKSSGGGSKLSSFIERAYKEIENALQTKKTGLYDDF